MKTPIRDFVENYKKKDAIRLHMPGHKGKSFLGFESLDITEIEGADVLYSANGIIEESQNIASELFGTGATLYSCEGSSLSIRAMLYLAVLTSNMPTKTILAGRNAHKAFMNSAAMLDFDIEWLYPAEGSVLSCEISEEQLDKKLSSMSEKPVAVYITSPDYLGNVADIESIAKVCHKYDVLLLCDNAHGAYRHFLKKSQHPIALGADMCCDSAHKTLPVLTGGGYLHINKKAPDILSKNAKKAMSLFASTSPSYLILQSLDMANKYLSEGYIHDLEFCTRRVKMLKESLKHKGFELVGNEELKITIAPKSYGYTGVDIAKYLESNNIFCEFYDPDFTVMMFTREITSADFDKIENALLCLIKKPQITVEAPKYIPGKRLMSVRKAVFSPSEVIDTEKSLGKILAKDSVACPPAIPIAVCGEEINKSAIELFKYYGITEVEVIVNQK